MSQTSLDVIKYFVERCCYSYSLCNFFFYFLFLFWDKKWTNSSWYYAL